MHRLLDGGAASGLTDRFGAALDTLWPPEDRTGPLGLAVSGGADSLALLLLAHEALSGGIAVASVDHGLRAEAGGEVALVDRVCVERGIAFTPLRVTVRPGNRQASARAARYRALAHWATEARLGAIATAHHADDQAETLLMRLVRGSGLSGLAGVRAASRLPGTDIALVRPLLTMRHAELEAVVAQAGIIPASDPSNTDPAFDRVRMRRHLADNEWLDADAIARSAGLLAESWHAIEWYAQIDWEEMVFRDEPSVEGGVPTYRYYANVPRAVQVETVCRIVAELGGQVSRTQAGRAADRLWRGENASLGGVLAVAGIEPMQRLGLDMRVWRFRAEPPRSAH